MKKQIWKKTVLSLAVASLALTPVTISANNTEKENEKEETVYVVNDASGNLKDVVVSSWLKNHNNTKELKDECNLKDVVNVKGKEKFTSADGINTWDAKGEDIYYQGSVTSEIPIGMKVTYTLNGKELQPSEILNKSGQVEIHVEYTNHTKVNYENQEYTVPMLMVTGMVLDNKKFSNVSIDNGKIINDGSRYIVVGFGLPGFNESLGLSEEIIPSSFTMKADVKKFSTSEMMTYAGNDIFNELDLSDVSSMDDLINAMSQLKDASSQLVNGSSTLADGIALLATKSSTLVSGINELDNGASTLSNGLVSLNNGLASLKTGSNQLVNGLMQVSSGIDQLMIARQSVSSGLEQITLGMDAASAALTQSMSYNTLVDQYLQGLQQSKAESMNDDEKLALANAISANQGSIQYQQNIQATLSDASTENTIRNGIAKLQLVMSENNENSLGQALSKLNIALNATMQNNGQSGLIEGMKSLDAGINNAYEGSIQLSQGSKSLSQGTSTLNNASGTLVNGIGELNTGAQTLKNGMSEFDATGIQKLVSIFDGDVKALSSKLETLINASKEYDHFSGLSSDMKGSVKFVIKSEGVE